MEVDSKTLFYVNFQVKISDIFKMFTMQTF